MGTRPKRMSLLENRFHARGGLALQEPALEGADTRMSLLENRFRVRGGLVLQEPAPEAARWETSPERPALGPRRGLARQAEASPDSRRLARRPQVTLPQQLEPECVDGV